MISGGLRKWSPPFVWLGVTDTHSGIVVECTLKNSEKAYMYRITVVYTTKSARMVEYQKQMDF